VAELSLRFKSREVARIPITEVTTNLGRDPDCHVIIDNLGVSRIHATIHVVNGQCVVHDSGSQNGTFVDGRRVTVEQLADGAEIQIGKHTIKYLATSGPPLPGSQRPPAPQRGRPQKTLFGLGDAPPAPPVVQAKEPRSVVRTVHMSTDQVARAMASGREAPSAPKVAEPVVVHASSPGISRAPLLAVMGCAFVVAMVVVGTLAYWMGLGAD
jgi:predicted component of type VI protein secretion system